MAGIWRDRFGLAPDGWAAPLVECIQSNVVPIITHERGYYALEIMLKAKEFGRTGQAQPIENSFTPPNFALDADEAMTGHRVHDRVNRA